MHEADKNKQKQRCTDPTICYPELEKHLEPIKETVIKHLLCEKVNTPVSKIIMKLENNRPDLQL